MRHPGLYNKNKHQFHFARKGYKNLFKAAVGKSVIMAGLMLLASCGGDGGGGGGNGSGVSGGGGVSNANTACVPSSRQYCVGGTVTGLAAGNSIVLQNNGVLQKNGGSSLTITANGSFTFPVPLNAGTSYNVSIVTLPQGQTCTSVYGSGISNGLNVTNVDVFCGSPLVGAFSQKVPNLLVPRSIHTQTMLSNGKILVVGGLSHLLANYFLGNYFLSDTELYDPAMNTWQLLTSKLNTARGLHTATLLADGRVLVVGGTSSTRNSISGIVSSVFHSTAEIFDPKTSTWAGAGSLTTGLIEHTATLLPNGKVLVVGAMAGAPGSAIAMIAVTELYDPATNTWTAIASPSTPRARHTATLLSDGTVLIAGGITYFAGLCPNTTISCPLISTLGSTEVFDPTTNTWSAGGSLTTARWGATATMLPDGQILLSGGTDSTGTITASTERYDPATLIGKKVGPLATGRTGHTATLLPNGKVLVAGGDGATWSSVSGVGLASAELFDPAVNAWFATGNMGSVHEGHTATRLSNGAALILGGEYSAIPPPPGVGLWQYDAKTTELYQ